MLYLAEVKKQTRGFIGSSRTELKLLACQHNDQTWSSVPGDEIIAIEKELDQVGEGALLMLNLGNNRQIQGEPERAGPELVRQLQKLSRLSEKLKEQQEETEQWKQSLTYQSQELTRREMEMETRLEQLEEVEKELSQIERRRREAESAWDRVEQTQEQLQDFQRRFGAVLDLPGQEAEKIQQLISRLADSSSGVESLNQPLQGALAAVEGQQEILNGFWQQLDSLKAQVQQKQQQVQQQGDVLRSRFQALEETRTSLEGSKIQWQVQQNILSNKQELLNKINWDLQTTQALQDTLERLASGAGDVVSESKVDVVALENMPLGELETIVHNLQADLEKLVRFVNDQEEELTVQCQAVQALQDKLAKAGDFERIDLDQEFAEELERKQFLDETLVGQRRNLKERQEVILQHLRVLRRRQGIMDFDGGSTTINLDPVFNQLEELANNTEQERQKLETEIEHLQHSVQQIQEMIKQLDTEQAQKTQKLHIEEAHWQQAQTQVAQLQTRLSLYQEALQPLQNQVDETRHQLGILGQWLNPS
ncbi:pilus motility taxis protein HmpF [Crocosphaera sp. XPORK-15E]|uniref:pilus motility taxis protein HmpF n=1 Tax=Crocosphaera sp. XPORK-15E TaxID=3110247 RepID=UPI002B2125AD|nr:pilus motility taxis protein HmpF [Crocosphaera sp. XPORK-15E]MEA5535904.1 pilus motility taxis protein HmpF [Crocosphaera sp. XPORK-15E]